MLDGIVRHSGRDSEKNGVTIEKVLIDSLLIIAYPDRLQHMCAPFHWLIDCITQFKLDFCKQSTKKLQIADDNTSKQLEKELSVSIPSRTLSITSS